MSKIRKLTLLHYYHIICRHHSSLLMVLIILFLVTKGSSSESYICHTFFVSLNLGKFLILALTFIILRLLKIPGQLLCRISINLDLSDISPWLHSRYAFLAEISDKWHYSSHCIISGGANFNLFLINNAYLDHLIMIVSASLH